MSKIILAEDYCEKVFDGTHETPLATLEGFPLVTSKHIKKSKLNLMETYNISNQDYVKINQRSSVKQWDILFSMIGSVGEIYLEQNKEINYAIKNIGVFSCNNELKAKWLYYYLQSPLAKSYIKRYLNGAVQKFLPLKNLRSFPIQDFTESKEGIVNFLSIVDKKIEINNQINKELESMAKTLYGYWFIQFDFPNKEGKPYKSSGAKMVYNEVLKRKIPDRWSISVISKELETELGGTPSTKKDEFWENGNIPWLNSGEIANFPIIDSEEKITLDGINNSAASILSKGSVVISIVRHIRASILTIDSATNQSVIGIKESEKLKSSYIYPLINNEIPRYKSLRTGAQQPHINKKVIDNTYIIIPDDKTLECYYKKVNPMYMKIFQLAKENQKLSELRNWLLPMLMNGQVKVKDDSLQDNFKEDLKVAQPKPEYN